MPFNQLDASTKKTVALPNGAGAALTSPIDLEITQNTKNNQNLVADCEAIIDAPALTVGELANGDTMKYSVESDWDTGFAAAVSLGIVLTQTGAGGVGAAAASARCRLPPGVARYVRLRAVNSGSGNASGKSASVVLAF
jgi:hypothetical protein